MLWFSLSLFLSALIFIFFLLLTLDLICSTFSNCFRYSLFEIFPVSLGTTVLLKPIGFGLSCFHLSIGIFLFLQWFTGWLVAYCFASMCCCFPFFLFFFFSCVLVCTRPCLHQKWSLASPSLTEFLWSKPTGLQSQILWGLFLPLLDLPAGEPDVGLKIPWENFYNIITFQFVGCLPTRYGPWFYHDYMPPTILLYLLLFLWM